jgi:S-adenosylmethionine-diacylglycerol 3-amino-3-carboxypropyl transferase
VAVRIKKRFELGVSNVPNNKNPYLSYILRNEFGEGALPEYLKQENFDIIRERIDRITLFKGDLLSIPADKYDFFNLSDIFEYMSDAQFEQNVNYISQITAPNGRIAYWNMQGSKYVKAENFAFQKELSEQLFVEDGAFFYKDFLVYIKENV